MLMNPPRKIDQTRAEYLTCEHVNHHCAPRHVVDNWVMQILENRRTWSALWNDHVHRMNVEHQHGYPVS